jgi:threonine synthase
MSYHLQCVQCDKQWDEQKTSTRCLACGEALDVVFDYPAIRRRLNEYALRYAPLSAKKYLDFYPLNNTAKIISLDEGGTPLYRAREMNKLFGTENLFLKNESLNPTGVFKDRGSLVEITKALELKATAICVASTGNMAASVSAYAAKAKLPCYVLVPENTPLGKLSQTLAYGARLLQIRGGYTEATDLAAQIAQKFGYYLAGDYAFRGEGQKSIAFEIIEQLGWKSPDAVVVPVGCGTNLAAIWKGFQEFYTLGLIDKLPKMIAVQPEGCSTIVNAFLEKKSQAIFIAKPDTVASAVGIGRPLDDWKCLKALRDSGGTGINLTDEETLRAEQDLARLESTFVEPSAALPVAAIPHLLKKKILKPSDIIIAVVTGAGLKDPRTILKVLPSPPAVDATLPEVERFIKFKLYEMRGVAEDERKKKLWTKPPEASELHALIQKEFNVNLKEKHIQDILEAIRQFEEKGKTVAKKDLQHLIEDVLRGLTRQEKILSVEDFTIHTEKHRRPKASVRVKFFEEISEAESEGVGPVDAALNAIRKIIAKKDLLKPTLTDYQVSVDSAGTDATVEIKITMRDHEGNTVTATATSPDVIAASIGAFEKGYNLLYWRGRE